MRNITAPEIMRAAQALEKIIPAGLQSIYGIPRGGVPAAYALANTRKYFRVVTDPIMADIVVDDLIDSGATMARAQIEHPMKFYCALFDKGNTGNRDAVGAIIAKDEWVVFPWEGDPVGSASDIVTRMLQYIGEDATREGLKETPARVIKAWDEWFSGYKVDPVAVLKTFEDGAQNVDEMVLVKDIPFYSHCEHHLAPFFGVAHVGYIPKGKIVGLSKLPRLVDVFARRLQVQERLTNQIADAIATVVEPVGVGVVLECRHLCMESRGIQRAGTTTMTSAMRGVMMTKPEARAELMALLARR